MRAASLFALALASTAFACAAQPAPCPSVAPAAEPEPCPSVDPDPAATAIAAPCDEDIHRAFDFWLGHWRVESADGSLAGHNHIERAHSGCAVVEHWASARGNSGTSTNYYDPAKAAWVQNWIDASGSVIQLEGGLDAGGSMVLEGRYVVPDGTVAMMRGTWTLLEDGRVRQLFETSTDEGATWKPWFEGFYIREAD